MRIPIIVGNWKMHHAVSEALAFVASIRSDLEAISRVERVIAPAFVALHPLSIELRDSPIKLAAQDVHFAESGAYTGEIAPGMLVGLCSHVIIGHSERRALFGETDADVNRKVHAALGHDLTPIVCVGENLAQNQAGLTDRLVADQVRAALEGVPGADAGRIVVAYEPVWAIGTGMACDPDQAQYVIGAVIRRTLSQVLGDAAAEAVRIQYGGSVNVDNIAAFMQQADIDGALVGGASLKPTWPELTRRAAEAKGLA